MINIPQSVLSECYSVFRRILPKSSIARSTVIVRLVAGRDGIRLSVVQTDASVEYHHPAPADSISFAIPLTALAECQNRGDGTVQFQPSRNGKVEIHWQQSGVPCRREYAVREMPEKPFPTWPGRDVANDPSLVAALAEAMQIPTGDPGRLALQSIQLRGWHGEVVATDGRLRGWHGEVVATDGRQLLIQSGFQFPWKDGVLVPRTPVFAAKELSKGDVVRVAQNKMHVFVRIGGWTVALTIQSAVRFPNVHQVIPAKESIVTRWRIGADEVKSLAAMLDTLPAAREDHAPVTLDLAKPVVIRAKAEAEKRCTDLVLPRSQLDGRRTRLATNRRLLQRALELGFREVQITAADKPLMCQDGKRLYVWVSLDPQDVLSPQPGAVRVMLPAAVTKSRQAKASPEAVQRPVSVKPGPPMPSQRPMSPLDGLVHCARTLWDLVRKHRAKSVQ